MYLAFICRSIVPFSVIRAAKRYFMAFKFLCYVVVKRFWRAVMFINSCKAIAGAVIGLLLVFLFLRDFCYDHLTSQPFCSFAHAMSSEVPVGRHFLLLVKCFLFICVINFWSHLTYLTHKNDFIITWKLTFIYL